jgi:exonuclease SbcC
VTEPQKPTDAKSLADQIDNLVKQTQRASEETKRIAEQRDRLNEKFNQLRQEARKLKVERDIINENVRKLKVERDENRTTIKPVIEEIKAARERIVELKKKTPKRSQRGLQREFDEIEWKIQTTSLDLKEEKLLIGNVKELEIQLSAYKKIDQQTRKIHELQQGLKAVDEAGEKLHTELSGLAQQSQELHQKMLAKIEEAKKVKEEADTTHNNYLLSREKTRQLEEQSRRLEFEERRIRANERERQTELRQVWRDQRKAEEEKRQLDETTRKAHEKELKEKLGTAAREKLQQGEKLSWEEFQLLAEEDEPESQD